MRAKLVSIISLLFLCNCGPIYIALYDIELTNVRRSGALRTGDFRTFKAKKEMSTVSGLEDEMFLIGMMPFLDSFTLYIVNQSEYPIKVIWEQVVYVDETGKKRRIIHSGINYEDRHEPQAPSFIAAGDTLKTKIYPVDYINYHDEVGWRSRNLLPTMDINSARLEKKSSAVKGKNIRVIVTLEIEGLIEKYDCVFKVKNVRVELFKEGLYMYR